MARKTLIIKENRINQITLKLKNFWSSEDTIKGGKRQARVREIICTTYIQQRIHTQDIKDPYRITIKSKQADIKMDNSEWH